MKKILLTLCFLVSFSFASDCQIITSPLDTKSMTFGYSNWQGLIVPIVDGETFKYTDFLTAYERFDNSVRQNIKEAVCKKSGWDGVVNYKIQWQQTDKKYNMIATYDAFAYKK